MKGKSLISVVVCTYNGEKFIREQLSSIFEQTRSPDEVIICDDASSDNTIYAVKQIVCRYKVYSTLFTNPRTLGVTGNYAQAISRASGNLIFLSDQDDVWYPKRIEIMLRRFEADGQIGLVYCDGRVVDEYLQPLGSTVFGSRRVAKLAQGHQRAIPEVIRSPDLKGCLLAFRSSLRSFILPIPVFAVERGWGHDHWIAIIAHATTRIGVINEPLMDYRRHRNNSGGDDILTSATRRKLSSLAYLLTQRGHSSVHLAEVHRLNILRARLSELYMNYAERVTDLPKLKGYLETIDDRMSAVNKRCEMRHVNRIKRLSKVCCLIANRSYSKHFNGIWSAARDVVYK